MKIPMLHLLVLNTRNKNLRNNQETQIYLENR